MASNDTPRHTHHRWHRPALLTLSVLVPLVLAACSAAGPRESPLIGATEGSPTVTEVYRDQQSGQGAQGRNLQARDNLQLASRARTVDGRDARQSKYWDPLNPTQQRFARVPNPDLVMVVYPHLAKGKYPVPGYVTVLPMFESVEYALPGEIEQEDSQARERFIPSR
ncbi:TIGR03751 family conjugal transfer lipoprotein [Hydrogenophaga flava]|uniref:TIGR03751 family conjugal transfer lipoprotein n=1 Tax=Hydrogenophaga flava TaxID=65657 RepID=UPI000824BD3E|nr:TIGR03751 family conjugal transfer lipoprotein [Hydrogenophaga flava]